MGAFSLAEYHAAERNAGLLLTLLGLASAGSAVRIVRARGPLTAMAWPLALCALVVACRRLLLLRFFTPVHRR